MIPVLIAVLVAVLAAPDPIPGCDHVALVTDFAGTPQRFECEKPALINEVPR